MHVIWALKSQLGFADSDIDATSSLGRLGVDAHDLVELLEDFGIRPTRKQLSSLKTVQQLVDFIVADAAS